MPRSTLNGRTMMSNKKDKKTKNLKGVIVNTILVYAILSIIGLVLICITLILASGATSKFSEKIYPFNLEAQYLNDRLEKSTLLISLWIQSPSEKLKNELENINKSDIPKASSALKRLAENKNETKAIHHIQENLSKLRWLEWRIIDTKKSPGHIPSLDYYNRKLLPLTYEVKNHLRFAQKSQKTNSYPLLETYIAVSNIQSSVLAYIYSGRANPLAKAEENIKRINDLTQKHELNNQHETHSLLRLYTTMAKRVIALRESEHWNGVDYLYSQQYLPLRDQIYGQLYKLIQSNNQTSTKAQHLIKLLLIICLGISAIILCLLALFGFQIFRKMNRHVLNPLSELTDSINQAAKGNANPLKEKKYIYDFQGVAKAFNNMIDQRNLHIKEITEKTEEIDYITHHDTLTGLINYEQFKVEFERQKRSHLPDKQLLLVYLRLSKLDVLNTVQGEQKTNEALVRFSKYLTTFKSGEPLFAKISHSRILGLIQYSKNIDLGALMKELQEHTHEAMKDANMDDISLFSIGAISYPTFDQTLSRLIDYCRFSVLNIDPRAEKRFEIFTPEMQASFDRQATLERDLKTAIEEEKITLVYQPQYHLADNQIRGCEALARWQHPILGNISPQEFIAIAESSNLIVQMSHYIREKALEDYKTWNVSNDRSFKLAVNVSVIELIRQSFYPELEAQLKNHGIEHKSIEIEITESIANLNSDMIDTTLKEFRKNGIEVAIDDFGTGYSSLERLNIMPCDVIKIDKAFVQALNTSEKSNKLLESIILIGKNIGLKTLAEGVETQEQASTLQALGCDYVQGYLYSKPINTKEISELIATKTS